MGDPIKQYLRQLERAYAAGNATEHTHRPALKALVESFAGNIVATNEPKREKCGAPDFIVCRAEEAIGYIECKDIGVSLDDIEKTDQIKRYRDGLDNLILTNYLEFRYYVNGEPEMQVMLARVQDKGKMRLFLGSDDMLKQLFEVFFSSRSQLICTPKELAARLANVAKVVRDAILLAFPLEEENGSLHGVFEAFRNTILPDITREQFADMYAQTICYGMFSARVNVPENQADQFSRKNAAHDLPATNPFLREVFEYIAGTRLTSSVVWAVDLLAGILRRCDMGAILKDFGKAKRSEDPVVHFYETFLAAYDPTLRESRGVYYTPEPVVDYIVRSIDIILKRDFNCPDGLADNSRITAKFTELDRADGALRDVEKEVHRVQILDPAAGTGTFLYEVVRHIYDALKPNRGVWAGEHGYVADHLLPRLNGFELMMAPYAVAHMKLGWLLKETGYNFPHNERLRVYLTNTLEEAEIISGPIMAIADQIAREANAAGKIKTDAPIMVVLGNPPYSGHSANQGQWSKDLIKKALPGVNGAPGYFECDGQPLGERNPKWLNDDYVKFIRFGQYRIERTGYGVLAFITNHGYLDNPTFRGMRQSLMRTFDEIYLIDLHGNTKKRETAPDGSKDENVFDIQQGVAIGIFIKKKQETKRKNSKIFHADLWGLRLEKYAWLHDADIDSTPWKSLSPKAPFYLFTPQDTQLLAEYQQGWKITEILPANSVGIVTARDHLTIKFSADDVWKTVRDFAALPPEEARSKYDLGKDARDWRVAWAQEDIQASGPKKACVAPILYRPFDTHFTYYTGRSRGFLCMTRHEIMRHMLAGENIGFITTRITKDLWGCLVTANICAHKSCSAYDINYLFPLYLYPNHDHLCESSPWPAGTDGRRPNLSPGFVGAMSEALGLEFVPDGRGNLTGNFGPEDVFHYTYAVFHSPAYRSRYAAFLKMDFPRLPLPGGREQFARLCALGAELTGLHLLESAPAPQAHYPEAGANIVDRPRYKPPTGQAPGRVYINDTQYFEPVPPAVWEFQIGGYQVCEKWLKDRRGRTLHYDDIEHYRKITEAVRQTIRIMAEIDAAIPSWPMA